MSYIVPFSQKTITLPVGEYIAISSMGAGQTEVYIKDIGLVDYNPTLLSNISEDFKTFGGYARDKEIIITSFGAEVEYAVGAMPLLRGNFTKSFGRYAPISVVVAAATFTSITASDSSGKVLLTSAGVHNLTSASVDSYVYVTWATGTGINGYYKVLTVGSTKTVEIDYTWATGLGTPTVAVVSTELTLSSYTVPANTLKQGSVITVEALASCTASAGKNIIISYGDVSILDFDIASTSTSLLTNKRVCQCSLSEIVTNAANQPGFGASTEAVVRDDVDATIDNEFLIKVTLPTADEPFILESYRTEIHY